MLLKKVIVKTTTKGTDVVSAILLENGCTGTTIVDKSDIVFTVKDKKTIDELVKFYPDEALVVGVIEDDNPTEKISAIRQLLKPLKSNKEFGSLTLRVEIVNSEHWSDIWQDYYKAYTIGKIKIVGTWQKTIPNPFKITIYLNPGAAFGTGQHPSTELVIASMQKLNLKNKTVLDIGSGSGILGICAVKLGAKHATLIDIDDVAIDSSELNSKTNNVYDKVTVLQEDLIYGENKEIKGDLLLINISSQINLDYAKNINNNINKDGYAILSGISPEYEEKIEKAYTSQGFKVLNKLKLENWITFVLKKI